MNRRRGRLPDSLCRRRPDVLAREWTLAELLALELTDDERAFFAPRAARDLSLPPFAWFLAVRRRAPAADLVIAVRRAPDDLFRALALAAIQEVDATAASRLALPLLRSDNPSLRVQAAFTLGDTGPASAAGDLKKLLSDPEEAVRSAATLAILKLVPTADIDAVKSSCPLSRGDQLAAFAGLTFPQPVQKHLAWVDVVAAVTKLDPLQVAVWKEGKLSFTRRPR
jgi:HEAT repeat protein